MLFQTTQAHEKLRARIRAFAETEVKPIAFSLDQANEFPADAVKKLLSAKTVDPIVPGSLLKTHPDFQLFLDEESAANCSEEMLAGN